MKVADIDFFNIQLDKKSYQTCKNILIYGILYKAFIGAFSLRIRLDEISGFIKIYDGIRLARDYMMQFIVGLDIL